MKSFHQKGITINFRIITYISYDGDGKEIQELVGDIAEAVNKHGFNNDVSNSDNPLKSFIIVKENTEMLEQGANEFMASELEGSLLKVVPAFESDIDYELLADEKEPEEKSVGS